jgi:predicted metalloprotease
MTTINGSVVGGTWSVEGKIARTGRAKTKTLVVERKSGNATWSRIRTLRKVNDGKYSVKFPSKTAGTSKIRVRVLAGRRTLAKSRVRTLTILKNVPGSTINPAPPGSSLKSGITGQISGANPQMTTFLENVYQNVANYWQRNYNNWGYGITTGYHYFPAPGEVIYQACDGGQYFADDKAAYWCGANDYIIFSQQAAVDIWNGSYAQNPSARPGDFAVAFVLAHEFGHNVTYEMWPNASQVFSKYQVEGVADCFAGAWAYSAYFQGILEAGDIEEAVALLASFGYSSSGYPNGDERGQLFMYGYNTGSPAACAQAIL